MVGGSCLDRVTVVGDVAELAASECVQMLECSRVDLASVGVRLVCDDAPRCLSERLRAGAGIDEDVLPAVMLELGPEVLRLTARDEATLPLALLVPSSEPCRACWGSCP